MGFDLKRIGLVLVLSFLLLFGVFSVWNTALVRGAEASIYIRDDGSIEGTTTIVSDDNVTYTFTDNINGTILIERNNIVIDGAGYMLQGEGGFNEVGIRLYGLTNVTIQNMQIVNFQVGVYLQAYSSNNTVIGNTFTENDFPIELDVSSYNTISENILTNNNKGIWLDTATGYSGASHYNIISGNNITLCNWDAIGLANGSSNNTIIGNNMLNNQYSITMDGDCNDNTIKENLMGASGWGIKLGYHCNQNIISRNDISDTGYGFYIYRASNNSISGNNIVDSDYYGILFYQSSDNKFWHNSLIDNTEQVHFDGDSYVNVWDDGASSGGNYWSDYAGSDTNGDGVGDTPYTIDGNNVDNYPLMAPFGSPVEKSFPINVGGTDYVISTVSNSTVLDVSFDLEDKQLSLNVTGPSGTTGFCNITVPSEMMAGDFTLHLDDAVLIEDVDYVKSSNATHYVFSVTYAHSSHLIEIVSTEVVPDFAAWLFIPFLASATLLGLALRRKLQKQQKPA